MEGLPAEQVIETNETNKKPPAVTAEIVEMIRQLREDVQALRDPNIGNTTYANLDTVM